MYVMSSISRSTRLTTAPAYFRSARWPRMTPSGAFAATLVLAAVGVAGCTAGHADPPARCDGQKLGVAMADDRIAIRVTNNTGHDCRFSGNYPVKLVGARAGFNGTSEPPDPAPATGLLAVDATYVQPYKVTEANGCPLSSGAGHGTLETSVEGERRVITVAARLANEIHVCVTLVAEPSVIEK
jgi:hypothetical protein